MRPPRLNVETHNERHDGATFSTRSAQEEWHFQAGWRRATARLYPEILRLQRMEREYRQLLRKQSHGCTDAYCGTCDD